MTRNPLKLRGQSVFFCLISVSLLRFLATFKEDFALPTVVRTPSLDMVMMHNHSTSANSTPSSTEYEKLAAISQNEADNLLVGKSCRWEKEEQPKCRDCGENGQQAAQAWENCPEAARRKGVCQIPRVSKRRWDSPHYRLRSERDETKFELADVNVLSFFDQGYNNEYRQYPCHAIQDCWDLSKCSEDGLSVYAYGEQNEKNPSYNHASLAAKRFPDLIRHVHNPESACLLLVFPDSVHAPNDLINSTWWNGGKNHLLFKSNQAFVPELKDWTFPPRYNYGMAALASSSLEYTSLRRGYDMAIPLTHDYEPGDRSLKVSYAEFALRNNTDRPLLLSFKGQVLDGLGQIWWRFRWLAYEYWHMDHDVFVDISCNDKKSYSPSNYTYVELLLKSTFAFCPGGGGSHSYRLAEALGLGAIPVVTPDLPEPFDLDWSGCWVRVSEARVVDLPRLLRTIPKDEIASRQRRCRELFDATLGWKESAKPGFVRVDPIQNMFFMTIKVWAARIDATIRMQNQMKSLESY